MFESDGSIVRSAMDAQYERRLLLSMNGQSSLQSSSPFTSPFQSPVKTSDRYIPLRSSISSSNLFHSINVASTNISPSSTTSPNKKRKYEQNQIGLGAGVTANDADLAIYRQLLQNTLLNTNVDSLVNLVDQQENPRSKKSNTNNENAASVVPSSPMFRYSERVDFTPKSTLINKEHFTRSPISNASVHLLYSPKKSIRRIPKVPYKVLDAPDLQDDFYLNLIDWSASNVLSVGLGACVYLCNAQTI